MPASMRRAAAVWAASLSSVRMRRGNHDRLLLLLGQAEEPHREEGEEEGAAEGDAHGDDRRVVVPSAAAAGRRQHAGRRERSDRSVGD